MLRRSEALPLCRSLRLHAQPPGLRCRISHSLGLLTLRSAFFCPLHRVNRGVLYLILIAAKGGYCTHPSSERPKSQEIVWCSKQFFHAVSYFSRKLQGPKVAVRHAPSTLVLCLTLLKIGLFDTTREDWMCKSFVIYQER